MNSIEKTFWIVRTKIQRFQYKNEIAYWTYFVLYRKYRGMKLNIPRKNTDLHIEGYPRSGNTYTMNIMRSTLIKNNDYLDIAHHCHTSASVKLSTKLNIPTAILLRNPSDAIASSYLKYYALRNLNAPEEINMILLKNNVLLYHDFYKYVWENDNLNIFLFNDFINNPFGFIQSLEKILLKQNENLQLSSQLDLEKGLQKARELELMKNPLGSSLPNEKRREISKDLKEILNQFEELKTVEKIYSQLLDRKVNIS